MVGWSKLGIQTVAGHRESYRQALRGPIVRNRSAELPFDGGSRQQAAKTLPVDCIVDARAAALPPCELEPVTIVRAMDID